MDRDEQIKIVKRLRERFEDDVYDLYVGFGHPFC